MSRELAKRILKGDVRAAAQMLTLIEDDDPRAGLVLRMVYHRTGKAHVIGVTGAAGTGKSTLIDRLTVELRRREKGVGILTVDPTSPFSGGALLGDRIRMRGHFLDPGVFIRSLATRGGRGGVPANIRGAIHLLDAMGKEIIFVETIGAGQDEVEIATMAHTVLVVLAPSMGDEIQGMKAGLMEIADIVVVNKADLAGADEAVRELRELYGDGGPPVLKTSAVTEEGVASLLDRLERHRADLLATGDHQTRTLDFCRGELKSLLQARLLARVLHKMQDGSVERLVRRVAQRELDPYTAAERVAKKIRL